MLNTWRSEAGRLCWVGLLTAAFLLLQSTLLANEVYVSPDGRDSNECTQGAPCLTIARASALVVPGSAVHVAPGSYSGSFKTRASGRPTQRVRYISDVKWAAKIVGSENDTQDTAWSNEGAFVDIDGFEVDGSKSRAWRIGLYNTGTGSRILNSHIHHIHSDGAGCPSNGGAGAESDGYYGAKGGEIDSNLVHDIGSDGCILFHGIYHTHDGAIRNNVVHNASGWGISLWHRASDVQILNNTVFNNQYGGITVGADPPNIADYVTVAGNRVYGNKYGIVEFGGTGIHNIYDRNQVYDNGTDWKLQNGLKPDNGGPRGSRAGERSARR